MRNASFLADVHLQVAPEAVHLLGASHVVFGVDLHSFGEFVPSMANVPMETRYLIRMGLGQHARDPWDKVFDSHRVRTTCT